MKIICDNCATKYSIADEKVRGKVFKIRCKKCSHIIVVRGAEPEPEPQPAGDEVARAFDQKETRVFDYSGFDQGEAPPSAEAAPAGEPPIWHVVIEREQVGPMTASEVRERFARGEIDAETYTWREGFDDWVRLGSVEDFAELFAGTAAFASPFGEAPAAAPFAAGAVAAHDFGTSAPPAEGAAGLFDAGAVGGGYGAEPSPLFASTPEAGPGPEPFRAESFGAPGEIGSDIAAPGGGMASPGDGAGDADGGLAAFAASAGGGLGGGGALFSSSPSDPAPAAVGRVEVRPMTGQRNENSVLFSLANLSALATSAPSAAPAPKAGVPSTATEGSGLIDIRAMAATTLGASKPATASGLPDDEIPAFAPAFSPVAAPVLLPTAAEGMPKWVWPVIGVGGALVVAIIVMVIMLAVRTTPQPPVVAVAPSVPTAPAPEKDPSAASGTKLAAANEAKPSKPEGAEPGAAAAPTKPAEKPAAATKKEPRKTHGGAKPGRTAPAPERPKPAPKAEKPAPKPAGGGGGEKDELKCLLNPNAPGCRGGGHKPAGGGGTARAPKESPQDENLKERLGPADIQRGIRAVKERVQRCYEQYKVPGMVSVSVTISPAGRVSSASVTGKFAGTPTGSCVAGAVRGARFDRAKNGVTISYPFILR